MALIDLMFQSCEQMFDIVQLSSGPSVIFRVQYRGQGDNRYQTWQLIN